MTRGKKRITDPLSAARELENAGFTREQSEAIAKLCFDLIDKDKRRSANGSSLIEKFKWHGSKSGGSLS